MTERTPLQNAVLDFVAANPGSTITQILNALGCPSNSLKSAIHRLMDAEELFRVGARGERGCNYHTDRTAAEAAQACWAETRAAQVAAVKAAAEAQNQRARRLRNGFYRRQAEKAAAAAQREREAKERQARADARREKREQRAKELAAKQAIRDRAAAQQKTTRTVTTSQPKWAGIEAKIPEGLKIQYGPSVPDRFAAKPDFERAITNDYMARRQGVEIPTRLPKEMLA